jgi:2-dehydro-3-deoxygluconokinase
LNLSVGGAESNTAIAVARLGGKSTWLGRLPRDGLGDLIAVTIRGERVRVLPITDPGPTSVMVKDRRSALETRVLYWRSQGPGSRLEPDDIPVDDLIRHDALYLTGITPALSDTARSTVFAAVESAAAAGMTVAFDVNYRSSLWSPDDARPVLRDLASRADLLFVGEDELPLLGIQGADADRAARELAARGTREVVVKQGARGATAYLEGRLLHERAVAVPVVDTVGAGDAFAGGYLAEVLRGAPAEQRLRTAAACGSFAVTSPGDWEAAPTRDDLRALGTEPRVTR